MRIVVALNSLGLGGTESYTLTLAEQLDRLGHRVAVYTVEPGQGVAVARERGIAVVGPSELAADFDLAVVQDAAVSFDLAERCPDAPQVFVGHSESIDPQAPPQLPGVVSVAVALNDRVATRIRSLGVECEVVRLRQPIDTERFLSRGPLPEVPRRALILSNNQLADRQRMLEEACAGAGLELVRLGGADRSTDPRSALAGADIVIGYGRSILEAMACGRAAYVYDWSGGDGWVTAQSYPAIEADGFAGRDEQVFSAERLAEDLRAYSASMGPVNHDLVVAHHRANVHAQHLLELAGELVSPASRPPAPLEEMARLVRLEWRTRVEFHGAMGEAAGLREQIWDLEQRLATEEGLRIRSVQDAHDAAAARRREVEELRGQFVNTLSWRLTRPLRAAGQLLRKLRRR